MTIKLRAGEGCQRARDEDRDAADTMRREPGRDEHDAEEDERQRAEREGQAGENDSERRSPALEEEQTAQERGKADRIVVASGEELTGGREREDPGGPARGGTPLPPEQGV
jgi:hypothetical protein